MNNFNNQKAKYLTGLVLDLNANDTASYKGAGSTWYDLSVKGNNGTIVNATYVSSPIKTFSFNGTSANVQIGQPIPTSSNYTICAWVNASTTSGSRNIVSSENTPFWISNGSLLAGVGGVYNYVSYASFPANQWKFVSVTFNDSTDTMKLYVDGVLESTNNAATQSYTAENTFIGSHFYGGSPTSWFSGYISQVYIYTTEQSSTDILNLFNYTKTIYGL